MRGWARSIRAASWLCNPGERLSLSGLQHPGLQDVGRAEEEVGCIYPAPTQQKTAAPSRQLPQSPKSRGSRAMRKYQGHLCPGLTL